jgi:AcrR family transcriptional regulator
MNTKEHILNVSLDLFLQKSFNEVTLKNISENSGMSKGAIYYYFETKEQIFLEIVNNIFSVVESHYSKIGKDSLYQFYHDYITFFIKSTFNNRNDDEVNINLNYFSLIFDALKRFPIFHEKLVDAQQMQLNVWMEVICNARIKGEIKSSMNDIQIASMFMYSSDGVGLYSIFTKASSENTMNKLLDLWDSFYEVLKV